MGNCLIPEIEKHVRLSTKKAYWKAKSIEGAAVQTNEEEGKNVYKILILGTGESGKSTLVKQMKIIHNEGYTMQEMLHFRPIILDNLVSSMKYVVTGMRLLKIPFEHATNKSLAKELIVCDKYFDEDFVLYPYLELSLKNLWNDSGVKTAVDQGFMYELNDSALYLFENMERISAKTYVPSNADILKARVRTIGVVEEEFSIRIRDSERIVRIFDVGGQRSERKKWIQCFDDVHALLFVVAISEYDMTLIEDCNKNRLIESLSLWDSICNNVFLRNTIQILFLNKFDLFREKILNTDRQLKYFIPEYENHGRDRDPHMAAFFIGQLFYKLGFEANKNKKLYMHFITATDTQQLNQVMKSVVDIILGENIRKITLL